MVKHGYLLRGLSFFKESGAPTILQRVDQEFIPAVLEELTSENGRKTIAQSVAATRNENNVLKLFQPVHRTFHLVLLEVLCDTYGRPRLDPQQIVGAGLVVRRLARDTNGRLRNPEVLEGWMQSGRSLRGWVQFGNENEPDFDPEPSLRPPKLSAGHPDVNHLLAKLQPTAKPLQESIAPLFVAPPGVCAAAKRTILYGLLPVTSNEVSEAPEDRTYAIEFVRQHLPQYLQASVHAPLLPRANQTLKGSDAEDEALEPFVTMLQQLLIEFNAFGETPQGQALFSELDQIMLPYNDETTRPAGQVLKQAAQVLINRDPSKTVKMPKEWPAIPADHAERIAQRVKAAMDARLSGIIPRKGRFEDREALYRVRGFIRVKGQDGCPPKLIWSGDYSEPFQIAPWYDDGLLPPVQVTLPEVTRDSVRKLKPNVAFNVPKSLFNLLHKNKPGDFIEGKGEEGSAIGIDWICGLNIPIITICAFIVLNIFLQLLNIIFWWLPFIKICIPFPRRE